MDVYWYVRMYIGICVRVCAHNWGTCLGFGPVSILLYAIIVDIFILFWSHDHIAPPILTRARLHAVNHFGPEGAKTLVPALQVMTQLQSLDLSGTLPPPTPRGIVCVLAYAFCRGLTDGQVVSM